MYLVWIGHSWYPSCFLVTLFASILNKLKNTQILQFVHTTTGRRGTQSASGNDCGSVVFDKIFPCLHCVWKSWIYATNECVIMRTRERKRKWRMFHTNVSFCYFFLASLLSSLLVHALVVRSFARWETTTHNFIFQPRPKSNYSLATCNT